ncbi:DNA-3-methyladenine glycosylase family protein [Nocardioides bruguierae]|uniref:DNA-3-methyladenine glycosylase 2 family protein n=1 Tax=Nocardioides bruguierae TaxID=2945102 RepID=A0A9X2D5W0_9ACTN|nr:DNA-3-methyladenine glycosylase 2 family protein [Nocardioides bruguierae]MCM0618854.1 DNA-3-methyladenine glycosylase 2 family protein [Nocardioides bruguierae]
MPILHETRTWRPPPLVGASGAAVPWPVRRVLGLQRHGGGDPTFRVAADEAVWRGLRTPLGPATLVVAARPSEGVVVTEAWGPGGTWALDSVPALLGSEDDWSGFSTDHPVLMEARRHHPHLRLGRTGLVMEALVPAIIEQKVTGQEAFAGFRMLVRRFGEPAPGPHAAALDLHVQPTPETIRQVPSWAWLKMHVDPARSKAILRAARVAAALERTIGLEGDEVERRITSIPGIGEWTAAEVRQRAHGDPDAVSFGDYHVAKDVGWALTGTPWDDDQLREFLEPYRPQRGRVPALVAAAGLHRPRRGARMAPRGHLPARVTRW